MLGMPGVFARPIARRAHEINEVMDAVAVRFGTVHFDAASDPQVYEPAMWAVDRLHPSERGHRLIARQFHTLLAEAGYPVGAEPGAEPTSVPPTKAEQIAWLATKGTAWVVKRSTDLVPNLLAMAFAEWREGVGEPGSADVDVADEAAAATPATTSAPDTDPSPEPDMADAR
jgi:hypothetical protein